MEPNMTSLSLVLTSTLILLTSSLAHAEVISITDPRYDVPNSPEGIIRPSRGMSMNTVKQRFGDPEQARSPVGVPPITRWIYTDFEVYFEDSTVIHSVVPRK
jgi:hypothetical protein